MSDSNKKGVLKTAWNVAKTLTTVVCFPIVLPFKAARFVWRNKLKTALVGGALFFGYRDLSQRFAKPDPTPRNVAMARALNQRLQRGQTTPRVAPNAVAGKTEQVSDNRQATTTITMPKQNIRGTSIESTVGARVQTTVKDVTPAKTADDVADRLSLMTTKSGKILMNQGDTPASAKPEVIQTAPKSNSARDKIDFAITQHQQKINDKSRCGSATVVLYQDGNPKNYTVLNFGYHPREGTDTFEMYRSAAVSAQGGPALEGSFNAVFGTKGVQMNVDYGAQGVRIHNCRAGKQTVIVPDAGQISVLKVDANGGVQAVSGAEATKVISGANAGLKAESRITSDTLFPARERRWLPQAKTHWTQKPAQQNTAVLQHIKSGASR